MPEPDGERSRADLETKLADLHRRLAGLHGIAGRAMEAKIEAVRRDELAKSQARDAEAAARRWEDAVATVRAHYPAAVSPAGSPSPDARAGTLARRVCDQITALAMTPSELDEHVTDLIGRSSLGTPGAQALIRGDVESPEAQAELAPLERDLRELPLDFGLGRCHRRRQPDQPDPGRRP